MTVTTGPTRLQEVPETALRRDVLAAGAIEEHLARRHAALLCDVGPLATLAPGTLGLRQAIHLHDLRERSSGTACLRGPVSRFGSRKPARRSGMRMGDPHALSAKRGKELWVGA